MASTARGLLATYPWTAVRRPDEPGLALDRERVGNAQPPRRRRLHQGLTVEVEVRQEWGAGAVWGRWVEEGGRGAAARLHHWAERSQRRRCLACPIVRVAPTFAIGTPSAISSPRVTSLSCTDAQLTVPRPRLAVLVALLGLSGSPGSIGPGVPTGTWVHIGPPVETADALTVRPSGAVEVWQAGARVGATHIRVRPGRGRLALDDGGHVETSPGGHILVVHRLGRPATTYVRLFEAGRIGSAWAPGR